MEFTHVTTARVRIQVFAGSVETDSFTTIEGTPVRFVKDLLSRNASGGLFRVTTYELADGSLVPLYPHQVRALLR